MYMRINACVYYVLGTLMSHNEICLNQSFPGFRLYYYIWHVCAIPTYRVYRLCDTNVQYVTFSGQTAHLAQTSETELLL